MTQAEYVELLSQQMVIMEKITDNTERQSRFMRGKHRSLGGLTRLLAARARLLKQLADLTGQSGKEQEWQDCAEVSELLMKIRRQRAKIRELQRLVIETVIAEKNSIAGQICGARVTRNIRNAYIGRWYQGVSRGFSRTV